VLTWPAYPHLFTSLACCIARVHLPPTLPNTSQYHQRLCIQSVKPNVVGDNHVIRQR
jgi:hypothetical protein